MVCFDNGDTRPRVLRQQVEASIAHMKRDRIPMPEGGYVVQCDASAYRKLRGQGIRDAVFLRPETADKHGPRECSMCDGTATHRIKDKPDLLCGRHRAWCEKRKIETSQLW
jgi:hypothetical protein